MARQDPPLDNNAAPATADDRARRVAAELQDIFGRSGEAPPPPETDDETLVLPAAEPSPAPRSRGMLIGAAVTVLLFGGAVGLLVSREQNFPQTDSAPAETLKIDAAPDSQPNPAPAPAAPAPPPEAETPAPTPAPPAKAAAAPAPAAAPERETDAALRRRLAALEASRAAPPPPSEVEDCRGLPPATRALCLNPALGDADARLGDAFETALDAGVPPPVLNRYRAEWAGLRRRSPREPDAVAESYEAMADELYDYAARVSGRN